MAAEFIGSSGFVIDLLNGITQNITGSLFLTLFLILFVILAIAMIFRLPIEFAAILIVPLFLVFMAATSEFLAVGGVLLIYLGVLLAKNFILK